MFAEAPESQEGLPFMRPRTVAAGQKKVNEKQFSGYTYGLTGVLAALRSRRFPE